MNSIRNKKVKEFLTEVSSSSPTPGGGSAAAVTGATAAALVEMVANLSKETNELKKLGTKAQKLRKQLLNLADEDAAAFDKVMQGFRIPKGQKGRKTKIQRAFKFATEVPLTTAQISKEVLDMAATMAKKGNKNAISDAKTAKYLAKAAISSALENVKINLDYINDSSFKKRINSIVAKLK